MHKQISTILTRLLRNITKLCIRHGIKLQELSDLVKKAYVKEAQDFLSKEREKLSISRIAVMTGIPRKDVNKYFTDAAHEKKKPNALARIIADWQHHPDFSIRSKKARPLSSTGRSSEFAQLVDLVTSGDLDPYTALFELKRIGAVAVDPKTKHVELLWQEYAPAVSEHEALDMLVEDSYDLQSAILYNVAKVEDAPANLHLKTEYTRIPTSALFEIRKWLLKKGSSFHTEVRTYLAKFDMDTCANAKLIKDDSEHRVAVGTFSFIEEQVKINHEE